ncbi:MAG: hypothetical protein WC455_21630 [Dehalococcoidia bacterium]
MEIEGRVLEELLSIKKTIGSIEAECLSTKAYISSIENYIVNLTGRMDDAEKAIGSSAADVRWIKIIGGGLFTVMTILLTAILVVN